jgi:3-oxoacyl-[acyl-carrier protein] reductase
MVDRHSRNPWEIDLSGRTVVVSGASWGIGQCVVEAFLACGADVHCCDIRTDGLGELADKGAHIHQIDLTDPAGVVVWVVAIEKNAANPISVLVNNAGGFGRSRPGEFVDVTDAEWESAFRVNADTTFVLSRAVVRRMIDSGGGRIINISSGAGLNASTTQNHAYTAAKHAVTGLTRQMAFGLGKYGIAVNGVAPGFVVSNPETEAFWNDMGPEIQRRHIENVFLRRTGIVDDIAGPVIFLASDLAGWMSGQVLAVNGGKL